MAFWILDDYAGPPLDYPTLGFIADVGDILEATAAPDPRWSSTGSGPETVQRYQIGSDPSYVEPGDGHVLTWSDADNAYVPRSLTASTSAQAAEFYVNDYYNGTATDIEAWQAAVDAVEAAYTAGFIKGGTVRGHGEYDWGTTSLILPSFAATGVGWDEFNPIRIICSGMNNTLIRYSGTDYAIKHATINTTTTRGQNFGVEIAHFTLTGPQDFLNPAHGIGIDNTRFAEIHHVAVRGFPGGVGVHLYGHNKGGMFHARVHDCRFGQASNILTASLYGGYKLNAPEELEEWGMRYGVWLDGPYIGVGKVNDTLIRDNQFYDMLIGNVKIEGHGFWSRNGETVETATLSGVTSATTVHLDLGANPDFPDRHLVGCTITMTSGAASGTARTINSYVAATRTVELSSDGFVGVLAGDGYTITAPASKGSSANTLSMGNVYFMSGPRKLEEATKPGTLSDAATLIGVPTTTVMRLFNHDDGDYGVDDDIVGYSLSIYNTGGAAWESQTVTDYVASDRTTTVGSAYSFTPVFGDKYRLLPPGGLSAVTSTTVMRLRQGQVGGALEGTTYLNADNDLVGYYLAVRDEDDRWHRRYITAFDGDTREVTVDPAFPFTPVVGNDYRVGYADAQAAVDFPDCDNLQHAFRWASAYSARSIGDYFEESRWLTAHENANSDFTFTAPEDVVNDTQYGAYDDGAKWYPRMVVADRPRGSDALPAQFMGTDFLFHHPEIDNYEAGPKGRLINATGIRIYPGDVVRMNSNGTTAGLSQGAGPSTSIHVVVASGWRNFYDDGVDFPYAMGGIFKVRTNAAVTAGNLLIPTSGQACFGAAQLLLTGFDATTEIDTDAELVTVLQSIGTAVRYNGIAIGRAISTTTGAGLVRATIRGW